LKEHIELLNLKEGNKIKNISKNNKNMISNLNEDLKNTYRKLASANEKLSKEYTISEGLRSKISNLQKELKEKELTFEEHENKIKDKNVTIFNMKIEIEKLKLRLERVSIINGSSLGAMKSMTAPLHRVCKSFGNSNRESSEKLQDMSIVEEDEGSDSEQEIPITEERKSSESSEANIPKVVNLKPQFSIEKSKKPLGDTEMHDNYFSDLSLSPTRERRTLSINDNKFRETTLGFIQSNPLEGRYSERLDRVLASGFIAGGAGSIVQHSSDCSVL
jgi:hypothetical protein